LANSPPRSTDLSHDRTRTGDARVLDPRAFGPADYRIATHADASVDSFGTRAQDEQELSGQTGDPLLLFAGNAALMDLAAGFEQYQARRGHVDALLLCDSGAAAGPCGSRGFRANGVRRDELHDPCRNKKAGAARPRIA
jgi:hypothetical protein